MPRITKITERWFDWETDPDKGRVKIKNLSPGELDEINDESFSQDISYKSGKGKKIEPVIKSNNNQKAFRELPIQKAVVGWENFYEEDGETIMECNPENVLRAIRQIEGFKDFVSDCRVILAKEIAEEKKAQAKNLKGSASKRAK